MRLHLISSLAQRWKLTTGGCCLDCIWPEVEARCGSSCLPRCGGFASVGICGSVLASSVQQIEGLNAAPAHACGCSFITWNRSE